MTVRVVKIGGAALADSSWLASFGEAAAAADTALVIVHGGGPDITSLSDRLGIEVTWHEGRRVTPPDAMDAASMVLSGLVNKKVVGALLTAGVDAIGLSGVDGGLLRAEVVEGGALGRVGRITKVRTSLIESLIELGHVVVISPVSLGEDGGSLNVNADDAAAAVAAALNASELVFLTDVSGVRAGNDVVSELDVEAAENLVNSGAAYGGMRVKLNAGIKALDGGVAAVRIGDSRVLFDAAAGTQLRPVSLGAA
jgi:acetylglutamate kinase